MLIISIISVIFVIETILKLLEINHIKTKTNKGFLSDEQFIEFKNLAIVEHKFSILNNFLALILNCVFILVLFNVLKVHFEPNSLLDNTILVLLYFIINSCILTCLDYYKTMVVDTKHGFNKKTPKMYFKDLLKSLILLVIIGGALVYILLFAIAKLGEFWWIGGFVILFIFSLLAMVIYPNFIVPLFNKLSPVEGELRDDIAKLLDECGFKSNGVFSMDASKNDTRLNAYFAGMFGAKKVVLYDTLINAMSKDELLAVLAHELGHFKHKDILKMLFISGLNLLITFAFFGYFSSFFENQFNLEGFVSSPLFAFIMVGSAISFILSPILNSISRKNEFSADKHGAIKTSKNDMISALKVLAIHNKALLDHNAIYEMIYKTHPSLSRRISALNDSHI
ncbi:M48 family metallopeptidase [Campylobacter sp. 2018MI13]|uniref:M48 family metallopeptidase n=2 Tax=unclassified Campylobacter TaxID=2593542 RepID=UPI001BDA9740|nr:M48 family metallopeptidase [Campylobacter sp. 2018MI13]MBT0882922.1 M48 family metallopeptidase [Campylobacter sp. 2018MI13]